MRRDDGTPVVLVTGSSGLIGSATCRKLAAHYRIVGFDRVGPPLPPREAEAVSIDLSSQDSVDAGFERVRYAYGDQIASVIHLAAYYDFSGEPSPLYDEITVKGTQRMLRALRDFEVEQFVFSSTMLVHAPSAGPGHTIDEQSRIEPTWPYPDSKVKTEELLRKERGDMSTVILRIAGVYDDACHSIPIAQQIKRIYEHDAQSHLFPGDPSHGQAFVHLDDVIEAIRLCVHQRQELPRESVFLLGEPETMSYLDLQEELGSLIHGEAWPTLRIPKPIAKIGAAVQGAIPGQDAFIKPFMIELADDHYELDVTRARTTLGWEPRHRLRDTLPAMIEHLKRDPAGWYRAQKLEPPRDLPPPEANA